MARALRGRLSSAPAHPLSGPQVLGPPEQVTAPSVTVAPYTGADRGMYTPLWYMCYSWYMSMKRTNVYADPEDLAIIKEAAKRRGISEAEIIRQGIHLAAMANRVWDEPLFSRTFRGAGRTPGKSEVRDTVADAVSRETEPGTAA